MSSCVVLVYSFSKKECSLFTPVAPNTNSIGTARISVTFILVVYDSGGTSQGRGFGSFGHICHTHINHGIGKLRSLA